jgi:hypothetical protein
MLSQYWYRKLEAPNMHGEQLKPGGWQTPRAWIGLRNSVLLGAFILSMPTAPM